MRAIWSKTIPWTDASPDRLYVMFHRFADSGGKLSPAEDREYVELLQALISLWCDRTDADYKLQRVGYEIQDFAAEVLIHLRRKSVNGFNLRPPTYGTRWKSLIKALNTSIHRLFLTHVAKANRAHSRMLPQTDIVRDGIHEGEQFEHENRGPAPCQPAGPSVHIERIRLAVLERVDEVIGDLAAEEGSPFERVFDRVVHQVFHDGTPTPHAELPPELGWIGPEHHALIVSRVLRSVESAIADAA